MTASSTRARRPAAERLGSPTVIEPQSFGPVRRQKGIVSMTENPKSSDQAKLVILPFHQHPARVRATGSSAGR